MSDEAVDGTLDDQTVEATLDELGTVPPGDDLSDDSNLDVILDVPLSLTLEVGRTRLSIRELLKLTQGSVIELDRVAGEALDVRINGTLVAHGEVVVVNDKYGVRLTDVVSPAERIRRLR